MAALRQRLRFAPGWLAAALVLLAIEILIATRLSGFAFIRGSLGDVLATLFLHFLALACLRVRPLPLTIAVFAVACAIEASQALGLTTLLGIPRHSVLGILLGSTFSWEDIAAYAAGCLAAVAVQRTAEAVAHFRRPVASIGRS